MTQGRAAIALFGLFAAIYIFTARGYLSTYDYYNRFLVTRSIVERGAIDIPPRVRTVEAPDGRHYSPYSLGESIAFIPFYLLGREIADRFDFGPAELVEQAASSLVFPLATAGGVALLFVIARTGLGATRKRSLAVAFTYGLSTPAWPYSKWHNEQPLETFFLLLTIAILCNASSAKSFSRAGWAITATLFCRIASCIAIPGLLWLGSASAPAEKRRRAFGRMLLPVSLLMAVVALLNAVRFGSPFAFGYGEIAEELASPLPVGALGLLLSPGRGFLLFVPTALLLPLAWRRGFSRSYLARPFACIAFTYLVLYGSFSAWYGTEAWGPRYLIPLVPLSVLPLACLDGRGLDRALWIALALLGGLSQLPPLTASPSRYYARIDALVAEGHAVDPLYDPRLSPLVLQWPEAFAVVSGSAQSSAEEPDPGDPVKSEFHELATLSPNFWWIYAPRLGAPVPLVALLLGLLALTAFGSVRVLKRWVREAPDG
ncbi:MAG: hypothetical protein CME06_04130 [Gemmatimonadetes bacterium]|nr:hypothetical protein [Gemmatimonadota bacterium]